MTTLTNARTAGFAYLLYIAVALFSARLIRRVYVGADVEAKLTSISQHAGSLRAAALLSLFGCVFALVLAVTLYAITCRQDQDLKFALPRGWHC